MIHPAVLLRSCGQQQAAGHMRRGHDGLVTLRRTFDVSRRIDLKSQYYIFEFEFLFAVIVDQLT
jgi:hypothetical protein